MNPSTRASMGPPFENGGGCAAPSYVVIDYSEASMGPPFENGGGIRPTRYRPPVHALQWGRRSKTAEGSPKVDPNAGEIECFNGAAVRKRRRVPRWPTVAVSLHCFNGAAVRKRRRAPSTRAYRDMVVALQWGRRSKTAEGRGAAGIGVKRLNSTTSCRAPRACSVFGRSAWSEFDFRDRCVPRRSRGLKEGHEA